MAPFKSEKHRLKIIDLEKKGKIPKGTALKWEQETKDEKLPYKKHKPKSLREMRDEAIKKRRG